MLDFATFLVQNLPGYLRTSPLGQVAPTGSRSLMEAVVATVSFRRKTGGCARLQHWPSPKAGKPLGQSLGERLFQVRDQIPDILQPDLQANQAHVILRPALRAAQIVVQR